MKALTALKKISLFILWIISALVLALLVLTPLILVYPVKGAMHLFRKISNKIGLNV